MRGIAPSYSPAASNIENKFVLKHEPHGDGMGRSSRVLSEILTLLALLAALALVISASSAVPSILLVLLALTVLLLPARLRVRACFCGLGLLAPILPWAGSGCLLGFGLLVLYYLRRQWSISGLFWAAPYLTVALAWVLGEICFGFDLESIKFPPTTAEGWRDLLDYLRLSPPAWLTLTLHALRLYMLLGLFALFRNNLEGRLLFLRGLVLGLAVSVAAGALQISGVAPQFFVNQVPYWTGLKRYALSFSDPNAAGVFLALSLPLLIAMCSVGSNNAEGARKKWYPHWFLVPLILCLLVLGILSGSRSFLLGIGLEVLVAAIIWRPRLLLTLLLLGSLGAVALDALRAWGSSYYESALYLVPPGSRRIVDSISFINLNETFFSRLIFWRIGLSMWLDHFYLGVGFHKFAQSVPVYSQALGAGIGAWADNSNNFYLGLLAETGLVGLFSFLLCCSSLERSTEGTRYERAALVSLVTLLLLLFFGPHTDFDEVSLLAAALMAGCLQLRARQIGVRVRMGAALTTTVLCAAILICSSRAERGFYSWESEQGTLFRWTGRSAQGLLSCLPIVTPDHAQQQLQTYRAALRLRSLYPTQDAQLLKVKIIAGGIEKEVTFADRGQRIVELECGVVSKVHYKLEVSPLWAPRHIFGGSDPRLLGVQVLGS
ncbi:MAG: O-antigen ligase family protein [Oligoflexia bacterium]|nr:O-antigen ligase family protein [Oligoflexia bacterium]